MKKFIVILLVLAGVAISKSSNAQVGDLLNKAKSVASAKGFDVSSLASSIMGKLSPGLNLTAVQKPAVTDAVTNYLTGKSQIMGLQQSAPASYTQKQGSLFATLKSKLAGILLKNQLQKFMGMKPKTNNPLDSISQLFY